MGLDGVEYGAICAHGLKSPQILDPAASGSLALVE
jgi:hypothetical protein